MVLFQMTAFLLFIYSSVVRKEKISVFYSFPGNLRSAQE